VNDYQVCRQTNDYQTHPQPNRYHVYPKTNGYQHNPLPSENHTKPSMHQFEESPLASTASTNVNQSDQNNSYNKKIIPDVTMEGKKESCSCCYVFE
jgi:hypothetical protein